jgi:hypothetical protein
MRPGEYEVTCSPGVLVYGHVEIGSWEPTVEEVRARQMPPTLLFIQIGLGAAKVDVGQGPGRSWVVMADPEGNEFDESTTSRIPIPDKARRCQGTRTDKCPNRHRRQARTGSSLH